MSRARHAKHDSETKPEAYNAKGSEVEKEAEERAKGGSVGKRHKRPKDAEKVEGMMGKPRLDRPGRKRGGGVGADKTPLSTAARVTNATEHKAEDGNAGGG